MSLKKIIQSDPLQTKPNTQIPIPMQTVKFSDMKRLPNFKEKINKISVSQSIEVFVQSVNDILKKLYTDDELYLSYTLIQWLAQEIEYFLIDLPKLGVDKKQLLTQLVLRFFDNNHLYIEQMLNIAILDSKFIQIRGGRRLVRKSCRFIMNRVFKKKVEK